MGGGRKNALWRALALLGALGVFAGPALAQGYPNKPIHIYVPSTAGGAFDIAARLVAPGMAANLGQPVLVDNRPGAGGHIGEEIVAKAAPDGYAILLDAPNLAIGPALYHHLPFDAAKDFAPVTQLATTPLVLIASPKAKIMSVRELIALAKAKPGSLNYGHMGVGSTFHLIMELFKLTVGADIVGVPYKGDALIGTALTTGEVQAAILPLPSNLASIRAGRLRALAVTGPKRSSELPDVPTVAEAGANFHFEGWQGLFVPAKTPRPIVEAIHRAAVKALNAPEVRGRILAMGQQVVGSTPEEFEATYRENLAQFQRIVRDGHIPLQD